MKRVSKLVGIVSKPLQRRYLHANAAERESLVPVIERESKWMIEKMAAKGYRLEARVAEVYGVFTRGVATGTVRLTHESHAEAVGV